LITANSENLWRYSIKDMFGVIVRQVVNPRQVTWESAIAR
jgi:hypothetical protein